LASIFADAITDLSLDVLGVAANAPPELRPILTYHLRTVERSKFFRPLLTHAVRRQAQEKVRRGALAIHLIHESTLLVDDMLDRSRRRRGQIAAHCVFSRPVATAAAGWLTVEAAEIIASDFTELGISHLLGYSRQVAIAEALQWQRRGETGPQLLSTVRSIAEGDTGALFVLAAELGGATEEEQISVLNVAVAYHWLDDAQAFLKRGVFGGRELDPDERDGICTLVSAFSGDAEAALGHVREMIREGTAKSCRWLTPFWNDLAKLADE